MLLSLRCIFEHAAMTELSWTRSHTFLTESGKSPIKPFGKRTRESILHPAADPSGLT